MYRVVADRKRRAADVCLGHVRQDRRLTVEARLVVENERRNPAELVVGELAKGSDARGRQVLVALAGGALTAPWVGYLLDRFSARRVIATGAMIVILLGQIDLSVPWVVAMGGMMATAATGWGPSLAS